MTVVTTQVDDGVHPTVVVVRPVMSTVPVVRVQVSGTLVQMGDGLNTTSYVVLILQVELGEQPGIRAVPENVSTQVLVQARAGIKSEKRYKMTSGAFGFGFISIVQSTGSRASIRRWLWLYTTFDPDTCVEIPAYWVAYLVRGTERALDWLLRAPDNGRRIRRKPYS